jgi:hypothetical protein
MNARLLPLAVSLLVNAGLLAAYLTSPTRPAAGGFPSKTPAATATTGSSDPRSPTAATQPARMSAAVNGPAGFSWSSIETDDLDELARRLKAAGFSQAEVRAILFIRVERNSPWAERTRIPYWQSAISPDPRAGDEQRKRIAEHMKLQQKYSNPDFENPDYLDYARRRWGNVSVEKIKALAAIETDYQNLNMEEFAKRRVRPGEESTARETDLLMQQEQAADIAKVLTPEEFAEYERRASPAANILRTQLEAFRPTEAEYVAIFAIQREAQDALHAAEARRDRAAYDALRNEMTAKVKALLGDDRALDYEASIVGNDQTARLVSRLGLPARVATEVRQAQQDFTQRGQAIRANPALSAAERGAQLDALVRQAESQLTARLGATGFEAYADLKGEWIRALKPRTGPGGP